MHLYELDELSLLVHKDQLDKEEFLNDHIFMYEFSSSIFIPFHL